MGTGPAARHGFDLALTELDDALAVRIGSPRGEAADRPACRLEHRRRGRRRPKPGGGSPPAPPASRAGSTPRDLPRLLYEEVENPRWDDVARRCLSCTNCTMVCPTCFCHAVVDVTEIERQQSRRVRRWDSCFSRDHAQIHGKNFRPPDSRPLPAVADAQARVRGSTSSAAPAASAAGAASPGARSAIDLTEEVAAIRAGRRTGGET